MKFAVFCGITVDSRAWFCEPDNAFYHAQHLYMIGSMTT